VILNANQTCEGRGAQNIRVTVQPLGVNLQPNYHYTFSLGDLELRPSGNLATSLQSRELTGKKITGEVHFYNTRVCSHPPVFQLAHAAPPIWNGVRIFNLAPTDVWKVENLSGTPVLVEIQSANAAGYIPL